MKWPRQLLTNHLYRATVTTPKRHFAEGNTCRDAVVQARKRRARSSLGGRLILTFLHFDVRGSGGVERNCLAVRSTKGGGV